MRGCHAIIGNTPSRTVAIVSKGQRCTSLQEGALDNQQFDREVRITGVEVSFADMFHLAWKWTLALLAVYAIAMIPIMIIVFIVAAIVGIAVGE